MSNQAPFTFQRPDFGRHLAVPSKQPSIPPAQASSTTMRIVPDMAKHPFPAATTQASRKPLISKGLNKPLNQDIHPPRLSKPATAHLKPRLEILAPKFNGISKSLPKPKAQIPSRPSATSTTTRINSKVAGPILRPKPTETHHLTTKPNNSPTTKQPPAKLTKPDHPLHIAFKGLFLPFPLQPPIPRKTNQDPTPTTEALATYKSHTSTHLPTTLQNTLEILDARISTVAHSSNALLSAATAADRKLQPPFQDEPLLITNAMDGKPPLHTTISERMEAFEAVVEREKASLMDNWGKWRDIQGKLRGMVIGARVPAAGKRSEEAGKAGHEGQGYAVLYERAEAEYVRKRDEILRAFEGRCDGIIGVVEESERKYEMQRKEQRRQFLLFMQAQIMDGDEDEE